MVDDADGLDEQIPDSAVDLIRDRTAATEKFTFTRDLGDTDSIDVQPPCCSVSTHDNVPTSPMSVRIIPVSTRIEKAAPVARELEDRLTIPHEFGGLSNDSPKTTFQSGVLRKYSSLNFNDSDTLDSAPSITRDDSSGVFSSPLSIFRRSQSHYMSPISMQQHSPESPRLRNKLRKKIRTDGAPPAQSPPRLDLPLGIEQIGNGIGYTRRSESAHARLAISLPTLTPRTCHALFGKHSGPTSSKKDERDRRQDSEPHKQESRRPGCKTRQQTGNSGLYGGNMSRIGDEDEDEDPLDEVLQGIYGSPPWASTLELSSAATDPRAYVAWGRAGLGLAPGDMLHSRHVAAPAELATRSTLRLVSPSTPRLDSEF
ncbi:hypothetical protein OBBRIDRAFT_47399 [Obba rivulosa]|uniref:Uncharacterized protein n=1 Tax=Obba rivulosa TaxID=1052685 RepID=A0A8E2DN54_9APHY|nr:hypothetical protein OBBRIDRAFT_47399 [Obba rivulosa]